MSVRFSQTRGGYRLQTDQWIPVPLKKTFEFFSNAHNLSEITPPWLGMQILNREPIVVANGTVITYKIVLLGRSSTWVAQIDSFQPPYRFRDVQIRGPYRRWEHTHSFAPERGGSRILDTVDYQLPFGILGRMVHSLIVRRQLKEIFTYREKRIEELLVQAEPRASQSTDESNAA